MRINARTSNYGKYEKYLAKSLSDENKIIEGSIQVLREKHHSRRKNPSC